MKNYITLGLAVVLCISTAFKTDSELKIDPAKSSIVWTGYAEAGNYSPSGTIAVKSGRLSVRNGSIKSGTITIDMTTLKHENNDLEKHLKDSDFFHCEKFPIASFTASTMKGTILSGKLTIKGITKLVSFPVQVNQKDGVFFIRGNLKIDRTLFNIKYNSSSFFQDLGSYAIKNEFLLAISIVSTR